MADAKNILILIPTLNPKKELITYVTQLLNLGLNVLIVDDGSEVECKPIFTRLENMRGCNVLRHAKNMGKGRALKNAFNYFLTDSSCRGYKGLVTADSDGQHRIEDVLKMVEEIEKYPKSLILGCRNFEEENIPLKSKFGNKFTKNVLWALWEKNNRHANRFARNS